MSHRRIRHINPVSAGALGAWDARRTGLADGRMASWPALPGSSMSGPTQVAADNTRPVLTNSSRSIVQFSFGESRRLTWTGSNELAIWKNQSIGAILVCFKLGDSTGQDQFLIFYSVGSSSVTTRAGILSRQSTVSDRSSAGGRIIDSDSFTGSNIDPQKTSGTSIVFDARYDWINGNLTAIRQSDTRLSSTTAFSGGSGSTSNTDSLAAALGSLGAAGYCNDQIHSFCILRPSVSISSIDPLLRRIQQHYCVTFGIPYNS